jgi:DNA polymerase-1
VHPSLNQVRSSPAGSPPTTRTCRTSPRSGGSRSRPRRGDRFPATKDGDAAFEAHVKATGTNGIDYWAGNARDFLVASPGYRLLSFDYQAAEMRVLAGLTEEPYLIQAFREGIDVHKVAASLAFKVPLDQVDKSRCANGPRPSSSGWSTARAPKGLADGLGISKDEAQRDHGPVLLRVQPGRPVVQQGQDRGQAPRLRRVLPRPQVHHVGPCRAPARPIQSKADRMCVNIPVQGGAADYCKLAMIKAQRELVRRGWWGR